MRWLIPEILLLFRRENTLWRLLWKINRSANQLFFMTPEIVSGALIKIFEWNSISRQLFFRSTCSLWALWIAIIAVLWEKVEKDAREKNRKIFKNSWISIITDTEQNRKNIIEINLNCLQYKILVNCYVTFFFNFSRNKCFSIFQFTS